MIQRILNSPLPAMAYNPPRVFSLSYFQALDGAGILPVLDTQFMNAPDARAAISQLGDAGFPFGLRLTEDQKELTEKIDGQAPANLDLVVLGNCRQASCLPRTGCKILVEVLDIDLKEDLERLCPHGIVVRGNEAPGPVSAYSSFILMQHYLENSDLPVLVHGGVGRHTAPGLFAAGVNGIVLDDQLYLTAEAPLAPQVRSLVAGLEDGDTEVVGRSLSRQYRLFAKLGTRIVKDLKAEETALAGDPGADAQLSGMIAENLIPLDRPQDDPVQSLFFLGQDAVFARHFVRDTDRVAGVVRALFEDVGRRLARIETHDPMAPDTALAKDHGTRYPIVQGPMANISDNAEFAQEVQKAGGLPFFALASLPPDLAENVLEKGRAAVDRFGVGLIGIEALNRSLGDHLALVRRHKASFAVLAAGTPAQVQALEADGVRTYLHTPSPGMLKNAVAGGCRRFVFEGTEAGGHVGSLSSLVLWELAMDRLLGLDGEILGRISAVFAGGMGTRFASYFVSGMASELAARGARVGIQVGSAYLFSREIVATGALSPLYQEVVCRERRTVLMGSTVGLASRTVPTPFSKKLVEEEYSRLGRGQSLTQRKEAFESDNLGSLLIAAKGFCPDFEKIARGEEACLVDYDPDQQLAQGNFMVGDALIFADAPRTIHEIHNGFFEEKSGLHAALDALEVFSSPDHRIHDHVAVVGMGGVFPGAGNLEAFWENIVSRQYDIDIMDPERLDPDLYWDADKSAPDKSYTRIAGQVADFVFDHEKYGYTPEKAALLSRSQQMVLEAAFQAAADAGHLDGDLRLKQPLGDRTAVVVATCLGNEMANDLHLKYYYPEIQWHLEQIEAFAGLDEAQKERLDQALRQGLSGPHTYEPVHGVVLNMEAARIAFHLGATGVNYTVDAACASSLAALDCGMAELMSGACDRVVVGGVNTHLAPESFVGFCKMGALSAKGSFPFDPRADGFVLGEGAGVVILKRLRDALRDGDRIHGVIRAVGSSSDGRGKAIAAPNPAGQALALERCFEAMDAAVTPEDVDYVEAHGTSTIMGDRAEMETLAKVYGHAGRTGISSVKSQIGHLLGGAGMAGLIKALLALGHRTLPPNGQFETLAHHRKFKDTGLYIIEEAADWPAPAKGRPRRAAVSSYGFGGINYHLVVEEAGEEIPAVSRSIFQDPSADADRDRIVVAGLGVVLPGVGDVETFWARLTDGKSPVTRIPEERFHNDAYAAQSEASGFRIPRVRAGIVTDHRFDHRKYRIPPKTSDRMDRSQCFALDAAGQALAQAGLADPLPAGNRTAVILGTIPGERQAENVLRVRMEKVVRMVSDAAGVDSAAAARIAEALRSRLGQRYPENTEDTIPGLLSNIVSGRIANVFGCNGANFVVDASCASATVATNLAVQGLRSGSYDCVIAGGADANLYPAVMLAFKRLGLLAEGEATFFDQKAGGYVMGEGAAVQVLTTYGYARDHNMPILGEINALAFRSSVTDHLLSPSDRAYARAMAACYGASPVGRREISHLDVFAGSNPFLDAVEKEAVEKIFPGKVAFGNVKPQFGYFKSANPAVVLTKLILMAGHRTLLPNRSHRSATSLVGRDSVLDPGSGRPAKVSGQRPLHLAANVNGIGGVHGHVVVGGLPSWLQAPAEIRPEEETTMDLKKAISAKALPRAVATADSAPARICVLLSGQGAQYPGMMGELYRSFDDIRDIMDQGEAIFSRERGHSLVELMFGEDDRLNLTENTQPAVFLASAALWHHLSRQGIAPGAFIGHSVGEYTALYCSGMVDFPTAMGLILTRSRLMGQAAKARAGRIMVVFADADQTQALIDDSGIGELYLANKNSPKQTAVSGAAEAVDRFCKALEKRSVTCRRLNLSGAFHSPLFQEAAHGMIRALEPVSFAPVDFSRVISNATAAPYPQDAAAVKALLVRQIISPVEFVAAATNVRSRGMDRFVEVGPKKLLMNLLGHMTLDSWEGMPAVAPRGGQNASLAACKDKLAAWEAPKKPQSPPVQAPAPAMPAPAATAAPVPQERPAPAGDAAFESFLQTHQDQVRAMAWEAFQKQRREAAMAEVERLGFYAGPVMVAGVSVGLPGTGNKVFDEHNFQRILSGQNFIEPLAREEKERILDMNITRVFKEPDGNARLVKISSTKDVIQLAGKLGYFNLKNEYGIDFDYDITNKLAIAAGIEALKDARIPLVMRYRNTSTGGRLPDGYSLPESMQARTGVILTSLFPGFETLIDEMNNYYYNKFYVRPYKELENIYYHLMASVTDPEVKEQITDWFFKIRERRKRYGNYRFDRALLFDLTPLGSAHFAQLIGAKGPNMQMSGACASTTQAVGVAEDWVRTGRCDRVIVIGGEAATSETQGPWIASGFLALGAATIRGVVSEAAKPFDANRNGTILGSGAVSVIVERQDTVRARGMRGQAEILGSYIGNSAFHGTRIEVDHVSGEMERFVRGVEQRHNLDPEDYTDRMVFMSHETFTPARGGSADAEVAALKRAYGENSRRITITNTKGFTGHTLGAAIEDAVLVKAMQTGVAPPIANLTDIPEAFADLKFSQNRPSDLAYGLHFAAGFGSHFAFLFLRRIQEAAAENNVAYESWLRTVSGSPDPELTVTHNTLCVAAADSDGKETGKAAVPTPAFPDPAPAQTQAKSLPEDLLATVQSIIAEQTGYSADMLEPDLDLEADLGIDTVKQVEVFGKVSAHFGLSVPEDLKLRDLNTIARLCGYIRENAQTSGKEKSAVAPDAAEADLVATVQSIIAEQTGYSADMLEADLDLEADLGIDTVKQVEVFGKVSAHFGLSVPEDLKLRDLNTIARLVDYIAKASGTGQASAGPADPTSDKVDSTAPSRVRRYGVGLVETGLPAPEDRILAEAFVLITRDRFGFAEAVAEGIKARGGKTVMVDADAVSVPETASGRIKTLLAEHPGISGLIHLAPLDLALDPETGDGEAVTSVRSFFALVKALAPVLERPDGLLAVMSISSVVFPYGKNPGEGERILPAFAGMAGLMKSAAREFPSARFKVVDFSHPAPLADREAMVAPFLAEIASADDRVESGYRAGRRFVPMLKETPARSGKSLVQSDDTLLVTGGARGITLEMVKALAADTAVRLVILGRSDIFAGTDHGMDGPVDLDRMIQAMKQRLPNARPVEIRKAAERELLRLKSVANIDALRAAGVHVDYHGVDVTDHEALSSVLGQYPRIDGVIHGAGIDISRPMKKKSQAEFDRVFDTKVLGTLNLLRVLADRPWRFFLAFSSVTARFGNPAQTDYTAANDMMGKILQRQAQADASRICKILDWTAWEGAGMATDATVRQVLTEKGVTFLSLADGVGFFMDELHVPETGEALFAGPDPALDRDGLLPAAGQAQAVVAPFLDKALKTDGQGALFQRTLDLTRDLFLLDHRREGVPIFLGATGIEAMAEAAAAFRGQPGGAAELLDFKIPYGIKILKGRPKTVQISATARPGDDSAVASTITSRFTRPDGTVLGDETLHYQGTFRFAPSPGAMEPVSLPELAPVSLTADVQDLVYHPSRLFMDGTFKTVEKLLYLDDTMLVTGLKRPTGRAFFTGVQAPSFLTDVVLVDAMFQSCGILAFMTTGDVVLPLAIERMGFFKPPEGNGPFLCRVVKTGSDPEHISFDVDLTDAEGERFIGIKGFQMVRIDKLPADDPVRRQMRSARLKAAS